MRASLTASVRQAIERIGTPGAGETIVVALSGGADSVALLDALLSLGTRVRRVVAAHLDHGLRAGSADDAAFCRELCERLGVPLRVGSADVRARVRRDRGGVEEAGRLERYAFLRAVKTQEGASAIAVAHTRDDQAETLLLRLLRGSGSRGLACMRERTGDLVRPLLAVSRKQVLAHLRERGLSWREDPTNQDLGLLRNRVRHELIPYLEARFNPNVRETLARSARLLGEDVAVIAPLAEALWTRVARVTDGGIALLRAPLRQAEAALARAVVRRAIEESGGLRSVGLGHVDRVLQVARSVSGASRRLPLPGGRTVLFDAREVLFARAPQRAAEAAAVPASVEAAAR
ncbi:MAG TPA: tRNA lysidine(34) synthetase TilS [Vicinamibacteria bacterium]|jgi:tRNA(Ile)-lysidine synthase